MAKKKIKKVRYPENLPLRDQVRATGRSVQWYADKLALTREVVSNTINGHYKGTNIVPKLLELINS